MNIRTNFLCAHPAKQRANVFAGFAVANVFAVDLLFFLDYRNRRLVNNILVEAAATTHVHVKVSALLDLLAFSW